jgi:RNA-directed DNA polymerase
VNGKKEPHKVGGSISGLLSNLDLHCALDLWFERVVKPRLRGEAYPARYIDDFVPCFQCRADAFGVQEVLRKRLGKFSLALAEAKTKLVDVCRFAQGYASKQRRRRPETIYFLGFIRHCTRSQKGNSRVGLRREKTGMRRALTELQDQMQRMRHLPIQEQADQLNQMLRGRCAYCGIAGNFPALQRVHRAVERLWRKTLSSRSWKGAIWWTHFHRIKERSPLL